jgi:anti-sigma regulatory factor (Ser/Thr protein kinase)
LERSIDLILPADERTPAAARRALAPLSGSLPPETLEDISLLVTELTSNSVRHSRAERVRVRVVLRRARVRVDVCDDGGGTPLRRLRLDGEESGWGLQIVEDIASRWGIEHRDGTCVWFEIDRAVRVRHEHLRSGAAAAAVALVLGTFLAGPQEPVDIAPLGANGLPAPVTVLGTQQRPGSGRGHNGGRAIAEPANGTRRPRAPGGLAIPPVPNIDTVKGAASQPQKEAKHRTHGITDAIGKRARPKI